MKLLGRLIEQAAFGLAGIAVLATLVLTGVVTYGVVARYFFDAPQIWTDELATYCLAVMVFCGLGYSLLADSHIRADMIVERLPLRPRWYCDVGACLAGDALAAVLLLGAISAIANFIRRDTHSSDGMQIPLAIPASVMVIGSALFLVVMVLRTARLVRDRPGRTQGGP
jgi:TRAP-type C4-dicarboxylate transport system permease small subunit